jgi:hypothetical protein
VISNYSESLNLGRTILTLTKWVIIFAGVKIVEKMRLYSNIEGLVFGLAFLEK